MAVVEVLPVRTSAHLHNLIDYVKSDNKTQSKEYITNVGCQLETVYKDFGYIKKMHGKSGGVLAHQMIQSFVIGETEPDAAHRLGCELAERTLPGYQYSICTHLDKKHIHNHIVFNSVSMETGEKYHSNKKSLAIMREESDKLCRENGFKIINKKSGLKKIDRITYEMASRGESWKVALLNDLDLAGSSCQGKEQFISFLNEKGYEVKYTEKNIVIRKNSEKKGIRVDTLAKQFGVEYTKNEIEKSLGIVSTTEEIVKPGKGIDETADYNYSEWQRYEKHTFSSKKLRDAASVGKKISPAASQILSLERSMKYSRDVPMLFIKILVYALMRTDKDAAREAKNIKAYYKRVGTMQNKKYKIESITPKIQQVFGNISYNRLVSVAGENITLRISAQKMIDMQGVPIFYSGLIKDDGNVLITFKKINVNIVSQALNIPLENMLTQGELNQERTNISILREMARKEKTVLCSSKCSAEQVIEIDKAGVVFISAIRNGFYNVAFLQTDLDKVCAVTGEPIAEAIQKIEMEKSKKSYYELKKAAVAMESKIEYRVVTAEQMERLKDINIKHSVFPKGDKYNIAFMSADKLKFEKVHAEQQALGVDKKSKDKGENYDHRR